MLFSYCVMFDKMLIYFHCSCFTVDVTDAPKISQENSYVEAEEPVTNEVQTTVESEEEEEEAEESRGDRFKTERTTILSLKTSSKSYGNIPDSLGLFNLDLFNKKCILIL